MPTEPVISADQFPLASGTAHAGVTSGTAPGPRLVIPLPGAAVFTEAANDAALARIRAGYSNKAGLKVSIADGGTITGFVDLERGPITATGYSTWRRKTGLEAGAEITLDLSKD